MLSENAVNISHAAFRVFFGKGWGVNAKLGQLVSTRGLHFFYVLRRKRSVELYFNTKYLICGLKTKRNICAAVSNIGDANVG